MAVTKDLGAVTAYGYAVDGGYTGTEEEFTGELGYIGNTAAHALASARDSEAYAKGTRGGSAVPSTDPAYENNSKHYAQVAEDYATAAASDTAEVYSSVRGYSVGEYVTYNTGLYKCIVDITTPEAWNATHWEAVTVSGELKKVRDDLSSSFIGDVRIDENGYFYVTMED